MGAPSREGRLLRVRLFRTVLGGCAFSFGLLFFHLSVDLVFASSDEWRRNLAEAWAPVVYQEVSLEFSQGNGFNPVDHLVGLFFDGNEDLRDNGTNLFRLSNDQVREISANVPVYYSVIETETHYYINYIFYHAIDLNILGHTHDTENLLTIVQKDHSHYGNLVMHIANAHGFPMIYGEDRHAETQWRSKAKNSLARKFLPLLDRHSTKHHYTDRPLYIDRESSKAIQIFSATKTHALYKWNAKAWRESDAKGVAYYSKNCLECPRDIAVQSGGLPIQSYHLMSWDDLMFKYLAFDQEDRSPSTIFARADFSLAFNEANLPDGLIPGFGEERLAATLFYRSSFKTPYQLSDPAMVHKYFAGSNASLSQLYLYNPYFSRPAYPIQRASLE